MSKVMVTVLKGASGGFGEYDWTECDTATNEYGEVCETLSEWESVLDAADVQWEKTNEISGRIHNECGTVYKCADYRDGENDEQPHTYTMAWEQE